MLSLLLVVGLLVATLLVLLFQGVAIVLAYELVRLTPEEAPALDPDSSVSVVVAARNEEGDIADCLAGTRAQRFPRLDVTVVDGHSTDRTKEIVREKFPEVRLIEEPPLPAGWTGKSFACAQGAAGGTSDWILFLDADVQIHPDAVRSCVAWAEREKADMVSLGVALRMESFWERVILPFYVQMVLTYFRTPRVNRDSSKTAMANGQFLLVRRSSYETAGGHAGIRRFVIEDVALARSFRAHRMKIRFAWATAFGVTRMYRDRTEMREGLLKLVADNDFSLGRQVAFLAGLFGFFLLPLGLLPFGLWTGSTILTVAGIVLWVALFGKHVAFSRVTGGRSWPGLLYPVAVAYYIGLVGSSIRRGLRGAPVVWKGREYAPQP